MICNQVLKAATAYYPIGNTPAVSLTQDLPPEQDADILLLGCGDARNVLLTCFADVTRKIDVTCCDIEPGVLARNVLLYTLLIEDEANHNIKRIWNIYYHWMFDKDSLDLLETQVRKLLQASKSIDQWHNSVYSSSIRFWDAKSLSLVRSYWMGYLSQGLSRSQKGRQLLAAIEKAKDCRRDEGNVSAAGIHAASPVGFEAINDLCLVRSQWWDHGTVLPIPLCGKITELNPTLLYSLDPTHILYSNIDPLLGIPVSTAFTSISEGSFLPPKNKDTPSPEHLVNCAQSVFAQWASTFRRAVANKLVIRIFCGDGLAFCLTLRSNYGSVNTCGPLSFDIIDTSNIVDHVGSLNLISTASSLLKYHASSTLYTEMLVQRDSSLVKRFSCLFGVDVHLMSLLLGLVSPDSFTNATDIFEEDPVIQGFCKSLKSASQPDPITAARSRLRWRRSHGCQESTIFVEAKSLANFLVNAHNAMFRHEDLFWLPNTPIGGPLWEWKPAELVKLSILFYNRGSFASLLSFVRATIVTDWDQCIGAIYDRIFSPCSPASFLAYKEELLLYTHLYGVDNGSFRKPALADFTDAVLAPVLPCSAGEDVPEFLCVTVRVSREQLKVFTSKAPRELSIPVLTCSFEDGDSGGKTQENFFSSVLSTFGTWREQSKENGSSPFIDEDSARLLGTSDMFVSVMVPTRMLLQYKQSVPWVKCRLVFTPQTLRDFIFQNDLEPDLCFARCKLTSKDVFITRFMPGMSGPPLFSVVSAQQEKPSSATTTVQLTHDGSKIETLIQRYTVESEEAKAKLAMLSSTVEVKFESPLKAVISIAQCFRFKLEFPVPVSPSNYRVRIARQSGYIEVQAPLFDPLREDSAPFLFPAFISKVPSGATVPMLWTSTRIDLDVMPQVDLKEANAVSWLIAHASVMFSERELQIRKLTMTNPSGSQVDIRTNLKDGLFSILMHYTGLRGQQAEIFGLKTEGGIQTLFFPSCLRLDLVNHTVVLDTAMIPVTKTMSSDPRAIQFLEELTSDGLCEVKVSQDENLAWKAMMPALVERCRTTAWKHTPDCEYVHVNQVPLPRGLTEDGESPICSCGIGKFPREDYLKSLMNRIPDLRYMVDQYATRIALTPIFAVPYVEDCALNDLQEKVGYVTRSFGLQALLAKMKAYFIDRGMLNKEKCEMKEQCLKCRKKKCQAGEQGLMRCSRCKMVKYCSKECQKADWKKHKPLCLAA